MGTSPASTESLINKKPRRVNFLIGKDGNILEEQVYKDAIDPTRIVDTCERPKLKDYLSGDRKFERKY